MQDLSNCQDRPGSKVDSLECRGPLHVLLLSTSSGSRGGGELYLVSLAEQLQADGHEVSAVLSDNPRMDELAAQLVRFSNEVLRVPYKNTYDRRFRLVSALADRRSINRMAELLRRQQPDLIHLNKQNLEDGLDMLAAVRRSSLPHVTTIHITRSMKELRAVAGWARDWVARTVLRSRASNYLAIAGSCRTELRRFLGDVDQRTTVHFVRNGVSPPPPSLRDEIRRDWNCSPHDVVLGCVARIEEQKNPLLVVSLLELLPEFVKFVWVGDGRLRDELKLAARRAGVSDRLRIEGWRSDARARMYGFDVFVLPSRYEGLPLAILEAMAAGLPCVVSDTDGTREAVLDGECGRVVLPSDLPAWIAALSELTADGDLRQRMGESARSRYRAIFSQQAMGRATVDIYRRVLAAAGTHD